MKDQGDRQDRQLLHLMRLIYATVNLIPGSSTLSTQINQALFNTLTSTTLMFLAGIWTDPRQGGEIDCLRYTSLRHAGAFIKAHQSATPPDFQCIIPAIISTLSCSDRRVRTAAIDCMAALSDLSSATEPKEVYAYDLIYGSNSCTLITQSTDFCMF